MFASSVGSDRAFRMIFHNAVARALFACITENKSYSKLFFHN
jgi:hypothetical protein